MRLNYCFSRKEDYDRITKNISRVLRRFRISDDASDFAQEYVCGVLEGKHRHQTIDQFVIDVLRKRSGRKGSSGYDARQNLSNATTLDTYEDSDRRIYSDDLDARIHRDRNRKFIKSRMFELYTEGFSMKEIGEQYGLSEVRVSQKLKVVAERIEKIEFIDHLRVNKVVADWVKGNL